MTKLWTHLARLTLGAMLLVTSPVSAQDEPAAPAPAAEPVVTVDKDAATTTAASENKKEAASDSFMDVVTGSGWVGVVLWLALLGTSVACVYLVIDSYVKIRTRKIMQPELVEQVKIAMEQGDLSKVLDLCAKTPGVMSTILHAGFSNVEEGFDVIQDVIGAVADLESEKLLQKVTYLSVVSNLAPMLGLMGTVQGMILAFAGLATQSAGAMQQQMLALAISQALYTTIAGLAVAIPGVTYYYYFRNKTNTIILNMVITTIGLIKNLRNVEVVQE